MSACAGQIKATGSKPQPHCFIQSFLHLTLVNMIALQLLHTYGVTSRDNFKHITDDPSNSWYCSR